MIFAIVLLLMLGFSWLIIIALGVSRTFGGGLNRGFKTGSSRDLGPKLEECVLEDNNARNKIAVIAVNGTITSDSADPAGNSLVDVIKAQLDRAKDDSRVKAVILKVDSPGGEVLASDDINKAITKFQSDEPGEPGNPMRRGKPVICSMGNLAASGGYYISAPCRWIEANQLTLTGSIGVIMEGLNYRGLMDKSASRRWSIKAENTRTC